MKQYQTFHFESYSWNHHAGKISLKYSLDKEIYFEETIQLPEPVTDQRLKEKEWEIERALFALHLIGGISYYKTCIPRKIEVSSGELSLQDTKFWNLVYENGLGEFFYKNNIEFRGLIKFPMQSEKRTQTSNLKPQTSAKAMAGKQSSKRILLPIGGGKDSVVTAELLKKSGANITLFRMGSHPLITDIAHVAGLPLITTKRTLSPALFELNEEGALNGHVPITAYLSVLSVLMALLYDFDAVALSSERSANEGNVEFKGLMVNHQWSKSLEFEKNFRRFVAESIGSPIEFFSALRPFSELKIAELFSHYPQYFSHVTSCNTNWKILKDKTNGPADRSAAPDQSKTDTKPGLDSKYPRREGWCGRCPKCAFVFATLAAFLPRKTLESIFGSNFYDSPELLPVFRELLGLQNFKPFECVGTREETIAAFLLAKERGDLQDTLAMKMFEKEVSPGVKDPEALLEKALAPAKHHCIPPQFLDAILPKL